MSEFLDAYPVNTACIWYRENGELKSWFIGACEKDNLETMRAHLAKWRPGAEFAGFALKTKPLEVKR